MSTERDLKYMFVNGIYTEEQTREEMSAWPLPQGRLDAILKEWKDYKAKVSTPTGNGKDGGGGGGG